MINEISHRINGLESMAATTVVNFDGHDIVVNHNV